MQIGPFGQLFLCEARPFTDQSCSIQKPASPTLDDGPFVIVNVGGIGRKFSGCMADMQRDLLPPTSKTQLRSKISQAKLV